MNAGLGLAATMLVLALASAPALADQTVAALPAPAPISAFEGRVAWSALDPAQGTYRLMTEAGGAISAVPVAPRTVPFDVDLGPGENGDTVAAYSRCRHDPPKRDPAIGNVITQLPAWSLGRGCDVYRFDFATGREARIRSASSAHASEFLPSVWKGSVGFARVYERRAGRAGDRAYLYVRPLRARASSRRIPAGSRSRDRFCSAGKPRRCRLKVEPGPTALDLAGRRLAFGWDSGGPSSSVYLGTLERRTTTKRLVSRVSSGEIQASEIVSPQISDGQVVWTLTLFGDTTSTVSRRYRITGGELSETAIPRPANDAFIRPVFASALDEQTLFFLASGLVLPGEPGCTPQTPCAVDPGCSAQQPCELRSAENLVYTPVRLPSR